MAGNTPTGKAVNSILGLATSSTTQYSAVRRYVEATYPKQNISTPAKFIQFAEDLQATGKAPQLREGVKADLKRLEDIKQAKGDAIINGTEYIPPVVDEQTEAELLPVVVAPKATRNAERRVKGRQATCGRILLSDGKFIALETTFIKAIDTLAPPLKRAVWCDNALANWTGETTNTASIIRQAIVTALLNRTSSTDCYKSI